MVCRIDPNSNAKSVDIFNAEISIKTALKSLQNDQWQDTMTNELKITLKNVTFDTVRRPLSQNCIGSSFVLNKHNQDGTILKHKMRLVTHGFSQKPGIDFWGNFRKGKLL